MSNKLIGTDPNQVPSNADLGTAAFQDETNFLSARGAKLSAIRGAIHGGVHTVYIYDTTQDSDGGKWRYRTKDAGWYNEELNTNTRGQRKEFPCVAIFACETNRVVIYDGDSPELPMWMTWETDRTPITALSWYTSGSGQVRDVTALNGEVIIAMGGGALFVNYIKDDMRIAYSSANLYTMKRRSIAYRNNVDDGNGASIIPGSDKIALTHYDMTSVDAMVMPDDDIDHETGLPAPTVILGSTNDVTVVRGNGGKRTDVHFIQGTSQGESQDYVGFTGAGDVLFQHGYAVVQATMPASNISAAYYNQISNYVSRISNQSSHQDNNTPSVPGSIVTLPTRLSNNSHKFAVAGNTTQSGFVIADDLRYKNPPYGYLAANITPTYNTGWQVGNTLFSGLSTTKNYQYQCGERLTNGYFTSNVNGWTAVGAGNSITWSSGSANVSRGPSSQAAVAYAPIYLQAGKTYELTANVTQINTSGNAVFRVGTTNTAYAADWPSTNGNISGRFSRRFTPTIDYTSFWIYAYPNGTTTVDFVSITEMDDERGGKAPNYGTFGNALGYSAASGSIYKEQTHNAYIPRSPVAPGADLCGYQFEDSNRNFMAALLGENIGTGDMHLRFWIKPLAVGNGYFHMVSVAPEPWGSGQQSGQGFTFKAHTGQTDGWAPYLYTGAGGGDNGTYSPSTALLKIGDWSQLVLQRRIGQWQIYIDGRKVITGSTNAFSITDRYIQIHCGHGAEFDAPAEMALVRLSQGSTTEQRIKQMYDDERAMFQPNAKSTIYGDAGQVSAMAWDQVEDSLYVGNASGRNKFNGLVRTDHTLDAIGYSLSASNGMVAEE